MAHKIIPVIHICNSLKSPINMRTQNLTSYRYAAAILLAIFFISFLLTSCEINRNCRGAGRENRFMGYGDKGTAVRGPKRTSY